MVNAAIHHMNLLSKKNHMGPMISGAMHTRPKPIKKNHFGPVFYCIMNTASFLVELNRKSNNTDQAYTSKNHAYTRALHQ